MAAQPLWAADALWALPPSPYVNHTPRADAYEKAKWALIGLTLFVPRLILALLTIAVSWLCATMSIAGWPRGAKLRADMPLPRYGWRKLLQEATIPWLVRLNLFALSFQWINIRGKPASRKDAPIVVCNHQGFPDIWLFLWRCLPVGVSAAENMRFPVMGDLMMSQQTIFVDREDRDSATKAATMINAIARDDRWPRLVVYPEGNTCNGRQLCGFKMGPFQPGVPVQPIVISYARNKRMDPCWVEPAGLPIHIVALRLLLQFHTYMDVTYLPVMTPTAAEKAAPAAFAARVQAAMGAALRVPCTEHSFADTRLLFAARKLKAPPLALVPLEMDKVARLWGASYADCRDAMERFASAGGPGAASLSADELAAALGLRAAELEGGRKAALLATFTAGSADATRVSYRQLVAGLAPLARAAKASGAQGAFVERAVAQMRAKHLA